MGETDWLLVGDGISADIVYEECALAGVKRVAKVFARDIAAVTGKTPACGTPAEIGSNGGGRRRIAVMTLGASRLADELKECSEISGKREVYRIFRRENWPDEGDDTLVVCGSDKLGTIYGMFRISREIGVSPWIWWADVPPVHREEVSVPAAVFGISREPSVKYRGFFINDEWPSFGTWTTKHYGGFTAKMYEQVFLLLLRLNGNYLWPAMWSSSFPLDGPGLASAELADELGVVMGTSHHEPCLRASEEWDLVKGDDTPYGSAWNYYTNREGLLRYWEDGLKRSGHLASIITIGMRGERDSSMLGPDATLTENINLLKDIIVEQRKLIAKHVNPDLSKVPQMLALYKEVEAYYYGSATEPGMLGWEELEDVILLLCEDNYGNMRTLPTEAMKAHRGGFGMYYHFDYHGGPISYEWVNSTPLPKIWEQMTQAYECGIRDLWVVNVGDLKPQELPLSYFMDLAYDYDRYGVNHPNETGRYLAAWTEQQFGGAFAAETRERDLADTQMVLSAYTAINGIRRPEALNPSVYAIREEKEAAWMLAHAAEVRDTAERLLYAADEKYRDAFFELVYFPATASMNVLQMQIGAAINEALLAGGDAAADRWADFTEKRIAEDEFLQLRYHAVAHGKWSGMMSSKHLTFVNWNDEGSQAPEVHRLAEVADGRYVPGTGSFRQFAADAENRLQLCDITLTEEDREAPKEPAWFAKTGETVPAGTWIADDNRRLSIDASHAEFTAAGDARYVILKAAGRAGDAVKCFPFTASYALDGEAPTLRFRVFVPEEEDYMLSMILSPGNPYTIGENVRCGFAVNGSAWDVWNTIPEGYRGGDCFNRAWCEDVLNNARTAKRTVRLRRGLNELAVKAVDPWMVMQKFVLRRVSDTERMPYLGPRETYRA